MVSGGERKRLRFSVPEALFSKILALQVDFSSQ